MGRHAVPALRLKKVAEEALCLCLEHGRRGGSAELHWKTPLLWDVRHGQAALALIVLSAGLFRSKLPQINYRPGRLERLEGFHIKFSRGHRQDLGFDGIPTRDIQRCVANHKDLFAL